MRQLTALCCALLVLIAVRPALAQRWEDPPIGEWETAWVGGVVLGALAMAGTNRAPGGIRGLTVGVGITAGSGLGISLGHWAYHRPGRPSIVWPVVGAALVTLPLTMTGPCTKRDGCGLGVLIVPAVSALGALIAHELSQQ